MNKTRALISVMEEKVGPALVGVVLRPQGDGVFAGPGRRTCLGVDRADDRRWNIAAVAHRMGTAASLDSYNGKGMPLGRVV